MVKTGKIIIFHHVESQTYKIQYRVMLSRYRGKLYALNAEED